MMISKLSFLFPQQINSQGQKATFKNRSLKYVVCLIFFMDSDKTWYSNILLFKCFI